MFENGSKRSFYGQVLKLPGGHPAKGTKTGFSNQNRL